MTTKTTLPDHADGIKAIVDLANKAADLHHIEIDGKQYGDGLPERLNIPFDSRPGGGFVNIKSELEKFRLHPARRTGTAKVATLQSFIDLVNRHKDQHSAIFAETRWPTPRLIGVLNYHEIASEGAKPRHLDHRVEYAFPLTDELKAWINSNNEVMSQAEFAVFLEEHAAELASPTDYESAHLKDLFKERVATPTEIITLSRGLEVFVGQKFKRQERLSSGERTIEFTSENTNAKGEKVDVPGVFIVSVRAFEDGEPVRIAARLRYRAKGGDIEWFYSLYRADAELRDRVKQDLAAAARDTTLPAFEGLPEA